MRYVLLAIVAASCCLASASQSYRPPAGGEAWQLAKAYLQAQPASAGAEGAVALLCNEAETQHRVQCYARGLRPGEVYSLWLLRRGADGGWDVAQRTSRRIRPARADEEGEFRLTVGVRACPLGRFDAIGLRREPTDGEPEWALLGDIRRRH